MCELCLPTVGASKTNSKYYQKSVCKMNRVGIEDRNLLCLNLLNYSQYYKPYLRKMIIDPVRDDFQTRP
jgi:hypothetical protein